MKRSWLGFPTRAFAVMEALRLGSILLAILMVVAFFAGCQDTKPKNQADENSILREPDKGHPVHGEVGAVYGHGG